jgi:1-aminocyclopropane-1-carboxylate deaminase
MGAETVLEGQGYSTAVKETFERALEQVRREGGKPSAIPAGASDHPLGGLRYVQFANELADQGKVYGVFFDHVIMYALYTGCHVDDGLVQRSDSR